MGLFSGRRNRAHAATYQAVWNGAVVAHSDDIVVVDGYAYFPHEAVDWSCLEKSTTRTICPWKGRASYFDVVVEDGRNPDAAWHYPHPSPLASKVRDRIAFWRGVEVEAVADEA